MDEEFGLGKYRDDSELVFRMPSNKTSSSSANWTILGIFKGTIYTLGVVLILALITMMVIAMLSMIHNDTNLQDNSTLTVPPSPPVHSINITEPPKMTDIEMVLNSEPEDEQGTLWSVDYTPATTEFSSLVFDANMDGTLDLMVVQVTERIELNEYCTDKCKEDFGHTPCQVQLAALSGKDGTAVWKIWLEFAPFAANCEHDMNGDQFPDCILSGRNGLLVAIDIKHEGIIIWFVDPGPTFPLYNFYYPLIVKDFDQDGTLDLIITHGGDVSYPPNMMDRTPGILMVISGHTGQILSERIPMPDNHETYSSPVLYDNIGSIELILFGSGGETVPGSLWGITMDSLQTHVNKWLENSTDQYILNRTYLNPKCVSSQEYGPKRPRNSVNTFKYVEDKDDWLLKCPVWNTDTQPLWNPYKLCVYEIVTAGKTGTITPPVIIDYNNDGIKDLLVSQFNDHLMMMDGATTKITWDHYAEDTQSYRLVL